MISETVQEQATLYALGLLDAGEAAAFERLLDADAQLRRLVTALRETAAEMARSATGEPSAALKTRVLARVQAEGDAALPTRASTMAEPTVGTVVRGPWVTFLPWALAATFMLCSGALELSREQWQQKFLSLDRTSGDLRVAMDRLRAATPPPEPDALRRVAFCPLEPVPQTAPQPRAAVLWDAAHRVGKLRLQQLPPPGADHDYQLWVVEAGHKEAVSAGVVSVEGGTSVEVPFQPESNGGTNAVVAFALSLERAGGSPTNQGPILFLGKL